MLLLAFHADNIGPVRVLRAARVLWAVVMREKVRSKVTAAPDGRTRTQNGSGRAQVILDEINVGLLRALLDDPRLAIAELARRVELSGPAVADRLQRLEAAGVTCIDRLAEVLVALGNRRLVDRTEWDADGRLAFAAIAAGVADVAVHPSWRWPSARAEVRSPSAINRLSGRSLTEPRPGCARNRAFRHEGSAGKRGQVAPSVRPRRAIATYARRPPCSTPRPGDAYAGRATLAGDSRSPAADYWRARCAHGLHPARASARVRHSHGAAAPRPHAGPDARRARIGVDGRAGFPRGGPDCLSVGDQIRTGNHEGTVQEINFRSTILKSYDGVQVLVPNGAVSTQLLENLTRSGTHRLTILLGINQAAPVAHARRIILAELRQASGVLAEPPPMVLFEGIGDFANMLQVLLWTNRQPNCRNGSRARRVTERFHQALENAGINSPYPIQNVRIESVRPVSLHLSHRANMRAMTVDDAACA